MSESAEGYDTEVESETVQGTTPEAVPRAGGTLLGAVVAEIVGTFILVFIGAGTVIALNRPIGGVADPTSFSAFTVSISLAFGFAVLVAVYAFGHVSGAHINPTVTVALATVKKFPWRAVPAYLGAQFVGAILGALAIWALFGGNARSELLLGATAPGPGGAWTAFLAEVILGFLLVVVVMATATDERAIPAGSGLAIGFVIAAGIFVTINISGGSFNAARSLGPMIVAGQFPGWWVYLIAPTLGGVLGALCYEYLIRSGAPPE